MRFIFSLLCIAACSVIVSCRPSSATANLSVSREYCICQEGKSVELFRMTNTRGMVVEVTNFAASLVDVQVPDKDGRFESVVLGFDSLQSYLGTYPKFGNTIGRYAGRIGNGEFILDGHRYELEKTANGYAIHGGTHGFNRQLFHTDTSYVQCDTAVVVFSYRSPHLEGGFPGTLDVTVAYKLTDNNEVILDYTATTDRPTVLNLTNHSYFNLSGCKTSVLHHAYQIYADSITQLGEQPIPTGKLIPVAGTRYDFTYLHTAPDSIQAPGKGYDINYQLRKQSGELGLAAIVVDTISGRRLRAYTTEPGMQFYISGSDMSRYIGHGGRAYGRYYGVCLEMQHYPDSPHHSHFPSTVLRPGEIYKQRTIYQFDLIDLKDK